jgi:hypothetical protein
MDWSIKVFKSDKKNFNMSDYTIWPNNAKKIVEKLQNLFPDCTVTLHSNTKRNFDLECVGKDIHFEITNSLIDDTLALRYAKDQESFHYVHQGLTLPEAISQIIIQILAPKIEKEVEYILNLE